MLFDAKSTELIFVLRLNTKFYNQEVFIRCLSVNKTHLILFEGFSFNFKGNFFQFVFVLEYFSSFHFLFIS
jgi:hypothetical protein